MSSNDTDCVFLWGFHFSGLLEMHLNLHSKCTESSVKPVGAKYIDII